MSSFFERQNNVYPLTFYDHLHPLYFSLSLPSFHPSFLPSFLPQFHHSPAAKKAGARAKPPSGAQSSGAPAAPPSETGSRGSSIRRASSQAAKSPTPVTSPSETGAMSKGRRNSIIPSVVFVPCNVQCRRIHAPMVCLLGLLSSVPFAISSKSSAREFPSSWKTTE